jgi:hypothetical protein
VRREDKEEVVDGEDLSTRRGCDEERCDEERL